VVGVSVDDVTRRVIAEGWFVQGEFGKGTVAAEQPSVLHSVDQFVEGVEGDQFRDFDRRLHFIHDVDLKGMSLLLTN
jgi:hypothetical protein